SATRAPQWRQYSWPETIGSAHRGHVVIASGQLGRARLRRPTELTSTRRTEPRAEEDRRATQTHRPAASTAHASRAVERRVDLLDARLDRNELGASLDDETSVEAVPLVHLECQAAEIAEPLLAHLEERVPFALELPRGGYDVGSTALRHHASLELEHDESV